MKVHSDSTIQLDSKFFFSYIITVESILEETSPTEFHKDLSTPRGTQNTHQGNERISLKVFPVNSTISETRQSEWIIMNSLITSPFMFPTEKKVRVGSRTFARAKSIDLRERARRTEGEGEAQSRFGFGP